MRPTEGHTSAHAGATLAAPIGATRQGGSSSRPHRSIGRALKRWGIDEDKDRHRAQHRSDCSSGLLPSSYTCLWASGLRSEGHEGTCSSC